MTREIKFRVWDKKNNERLGASDPDVLTYYGFALFGECTLFQGLPVSILGDIEVMQFTGLYDKNNQPIYESDIVSIGEQDYTHKSIGVVTYEGCGFEIDRTLYGATHGGHNLWFLRSYLIVIGNVYEHSHLLTDNQGLTQKKG